MMKVSKRDWIIGQVVIALAYIFALYIQFQHLVIFNTTPQTSIFFIPAAVRVFSVIIFGYWAGLGIALGTLIHDSIFNVSGINVYEMVGIALEQGGVVASSLFVWALTSKKIKGLWSPEINFDSIDALDVLTMCIIQAVINSTAGHIFFALSPTVHQQFIPYYYLVMLVGDITGAFFVFISANLIFSGLLRSGLLSREHYSGNKNERVKIEIDQFIARMTFK
jgi:hypothetical protein